MTARMILTRERYYRMQISCRQVLVAGGAGRASPMAVVSRYNICWFGLPANAWAVRVPLLRWRCDSVRMVAVHTPAAFGCVWLVATPSPDRPKLRPDVMRILWYVGSMCATNETLPINSLAKFRNVLTFMLLLQLPLLLRLTVLRTIHVCSTECVNIDMFTCVSISIGIFLSVVHWDYERVWMFECLCVCYIKWYIQCVSVTLNSTYSVTHIPRRKYENPSHDMTQIAYK